MANQELEQKHADELGVTTYGIKKVSEILTLAGSAIVGTVAGFGTGKLFKTGGKGDFNQPYNVSAFQEIQAVTESGQKVTGGFLKLQTAKARVSDMIGAAGGLMVGAVVGTLIIGYKHWRKTESQRLAVDEINKDMANTMAIQPVDKELVSENKRLRGMLEEMEHGHHSKHAAAHGHGPKSPMDHATREPMEHSRG